jgi:hypothetical protein
VWIEHDAWLLYGCTQVYGLPSFVAYEPIFDHDASCNYYWTYETFGVDGGVNAGRWTQDPVGDALYYGGHHGTTNNTWVDIGIRAEGSLGRWYLHNPCGITNLKTPGSDFEKRQDEYPGWYIYADIQSRADGEDWGTEYEIPAPSTPGTWVAFSLDQAIDAGATYAGFYLNGPYPPAYLECTNLTVTLDSDNTPAAALAPEQEIYDLDMTLTIVEDGLDAEAITIRCIIAEDQQLEIDCDSRTVTYLFDGSNQLQSLGLVNPNVRRYWFRLPGHWDGGKSVSLRFEELGANNVNVVVTHTDRYL